MNQDLSDKVLSRVREAGERREALEIRGGGTKAFLGRPGHGQPLEIAGHRGILSYEPSELVLTARAGTTLAELQAALAAESQMLPFEPPHFGAGATLGGTVACGLSGPRRPYTGALRDFVLGVTIVNGVGERLRFGGQVMKNVAGYDVSRLMAGAMGTLGVLLDISIKVLPQPADEITLVQERSPADAVETMSRWAAQPLPVSATCYDAERLLVRLSGARSAVEAARQQLGGEMLPEARGFWERLREHNHEFFQTPAPLWRLSVPSATPPLALPGRWLIEWGGAQRWLTTSAPAQQVRETAGHVGGHATLFRGGERQADVFHPLPPVLLHLHRNLKSAFDPAGILNPGRMYAAF